MKFRPVYLGLMLVAAAGDLTADPAFQQQVSFTPGTEPTWNVDWSGVADRTYFVERSVDLVHWNYLPIMDFGTGTKSCGVNTEGAPKLFVRLHYVDDTTVTTLQEARDADFDGDGIPNWYEVEVLGTDPLDKNSAGGDSDNNGLADGWEMFYFGGLGIADPNAVLKPDGLTNTEKNDLGLNPNTDYSAATATQPASYSYDLVGRLTGVTAPVGAGNYTPDDEGNILNAQ